MKCSQFLTVAAVLCLAWLGLVSCSDEQSPQESHTRLAECLTHNGWVMYGSITCSACRAQRKAFGEAFHKIAEIECNPNVPGNQVELCLKRDIGLTPTWINETGGRVQGRIESYQLLDDLARKTGCSLG